MDETLDRTASSGGRRQSGRVVPGWLLVVAGVGMLLAYLFANLELTRDSRPIGSLADLRSLRERDDVNVLFVLIDTLRADHLSSYGYERETSPAIDYLAGNGVRFARNIGQSSWTKTSMASLWTGMYPHRTDVLRHRDAVADEAVMASEVFQDAGFVTAGIWRNGWVGPNFGFRQGFETYQTPAARQAPHEMRGPPRSFRIDGTDIDAVMSALEFLRTYRDDRWFLYLHLMDVHQYVSGPETTVFGAGYLDAYDNSILWTDRQLMLVVGELQELDILDRTLIVIASDHGEAFGEHGSEGHARNLYQEVIHTPWVMSFPFRLPSPLVVKNETENVDLWPTVLDLLGLPPLETADGRSRVPELKGQWNPPERDLGFAQLDRHWAKLEDGPAPMLAARDGHFWLIRHLDDPEHQELYDLAGDPGELSNIAEEEPAIVARMRDQMDRYLDAEVPWGGGAPEVDIDDLQLRQLRALGYAVE